MMLLLGLVIHIRVGDLTDSSITLCCEDRSEVVFIVI